MTKKNTDKNTDKRLKNLKPAWKKGECPNPKGHPKGQRNFSTIYKEALKSLAKKNKLTPTQLENEIVEAGIVQARRGSYPFYRDFQDRLHGMPNQSLDLTSGGKVLPTPLLHALRNNNSNRKAGKTPKED